MSDQLKKYQERKEQMIAYLKLKLEEQDWHGVQDAASDLRDIESEEKGYKRCETSLGIKYINTDKSVSVFSYDAGTK